MPQEVNPKDPKGWYARKRSTPAAAMVFTAPGIPMLFQGQEFLEGDWFRDTVPLDWDQREEFHGIVRWQMGWCWEKGRYTSVSSGALWQ